MLEGWVAIVTGSSGGIGAGIAEALADRGAKVVVNSRSSVEAGREIAAKLAGASYCRADVENDAEARALVDQTLTTYGRLDLLVNNAGHPQMVPRDDLDALTDDDWHRMLSANVIGPFHMIRAAAPALRKSGRGSIINVSSIDGVITRRSRSSLAYASSKAALVYLTKLLAIELAPEIRVNGLAPGSTENQPHLPELLERITDATPLRKLATVREHGDICVALALATHMTGQTLAVDGGHSLSYGRP